MGLVIPMILCGILFHSSAAAEHAKLIFYKSILGLGICIMSRRVLSLVLYLNNAKGPLGALRYYCVNLFTLDEK